VCSYGVELYMQELFAAGDFFHLCVCIWISFIFDLILLSLIFSYANYIFIVDSMYIYPILGIVDPDMFFDLLFRCCHQLVDCTFS